MIGALLWKEWREQRWRCVLGTLVLTTISAGLVRAQLMMMTEAVWFTFGTLGLLLAVFLAMGSVATERADGTWSFYTARPIRRVDILRAKWLIGAAHLTVALLLAGIAAHLAAFSRGLFDVTAPPPLSAPELRMLFSTGNSAGWLWMMVLLAWASLLAWYTVLFFVLTRARNELHAGLGGVLLTLACLAWLLQLPMAYEEGRWVDSPIARGLWASSLVNPLSPLAFGVLPTAAKWLAVAIALPLWVGGTHWLATRLEKRGCFA